MRRFAFTVHHRDFDVLKSRLAEKASDLDFGEAEPQIRVQFPRLFIAVPHQIQDDDPAARLENPKGFGNRALGVPGVVQCLAEEGQIHRACTNGHVFNVAFAVFKVGDTMLACKLAPYSTIFSELSTAITFFARWANNCEKVPSPAPRSAMTIGGISFNKVSDSPFQERPGT